MPLANAKAWQCLSSMDKRFALLDLVDHANAAQKVYRSLSDLNCLGVRPNQRLLLRVSTDTSA